MKLNPDQFNKNNPRCPDFSSHQENAADRLFPGHSGKLTNEQSKQVDAAAHDEYMHCDGH